MASAAGYDPVYDPFDEMIANNSIGEEYFTDVKPGMVALKVVGDSMSPDLPNGSIVLVDTINFPKRGSKVVARLKDIGIVVKMYNRKDNIITLSSVNPNGQNFEWNIKEQRDYCLFMWQVRKSIIDEDQQRWENHKINGKIK